MRPVFIYLLIFFSVLCMATSSIIIRFSAAPAMIIALYRVVFTAGLAALLGSRDIFPNIKKMPRRDFILIIIAGFFLALHFAFWISSLNYTSIPSSVLFTNLQEIFVLLFSIFILREKMKQQVIAGIIVAVLGSSLIAGGDLGSGRIYGDMLALLSGFFVAVYFIIGRYVRVRVDVWPYTSMVALVAVLVLLPASALAGLPLVSYPPREWILFLLLALGPGLAGHGILNWALKYVKAPIVAVSILGESVGASILAFLVFGELLLWYQMIGGVLILLGIYVAAVNEARSGEQHLRRKTEDRKRRVENGGRKTENVGD